jgi:hypothetical protein
MPARAVREEDDMHTPPRIPIRNNTQTHTDHTTPSLSHTTPKASQSTTPPPAPPTETIPPTSTPNLRDGYTMLPLPMLQPTEIRVLSQNINTLPTTSPAELGASPSTCTETSTRQFWACKKQIRTGQDMMRLWDESNNALNGDGLDRKW